MCIDIHYLYSLWIARSLLHPYKAACLSAQKLTRRDCWISTQAVKRTHPTFGRENAQVARRCTAKNRFALRCSSQIASRTFHEDEQMCSEGILTNRDIYL